MKIFHENTGQYKVVNQLKFDELKSKNLIFWDSDFWSPEPSGEWVMFDKNWDKEFDK